MPSARPVRSRAPERACYHRAVVEGRRAPVLGGHAGARDAPMTERKPPEKSWDSWIEDLIQQARAEGAFDNLEGQGKPIPGIDAPYDPDWWAKKLLEREKLSVLPLALEVRAKVERALDEVWQLRREDEVRERVTAINAQIVRANRTTAEGPPTSLASLEVDAVLAEWRRRRRDI
jgi:hypothetical protein